MTAGIRLVASAALALSACVAAVEAPAPETAALQTPAVSLEVSEPVAEIAVAPEPEPAPEPAEPVVSEPAEPPPEPAPEPVEETVARLAPPPEIDDDPEQVIGLDRGALEALLGAPGFVREDADARVWQYRGAGCVLDAFLYPYRQADEDIFIGPAASATARRAPWRESQGAGWPRPAPEGTKASPFVGSPVSDALAEPYRVTYYEIRGDAGDDRARRRCFRSLLPARNRG